MRFVVALIFILITLLPSSALTREQLDLSMIDLDHYDLLVIKVQSPISGLGEVSWRSKQQKYSNERTYPFYIKASDQQRTYYLDLKAYVKPDKIDHLLFFGPEGSKLISVTPVKGSLFQIVTAAWQEFWGPQGRERAGDAFMIIHPVKLFNRSIFIYLNWLVGFIMLIALISRRPKLAIFTILGLWGALEISSLANNWHYFKADKKYLGKTLEQKRAIQNYKDFYAFIKHAENHIPEQASFLLITQPKYRFSKRRSQYYLYPRTWIEQEPLFILLFDKYPNQRLLRDHRLVSKFRPGAYILKRIIHDN